MNISKADANGVEKHPKNHWRGTRRRCGEEGCSKHYSTNDDLNAAGQEEFSVSEKFSLFDSKRRLVMYMRITRMGRE
jgi:hypothetical protein